MNYDKILKGGCSNTKLGSSIGCCSIDTMVLPVEAVNITRKQAEKLKEKGFITIQRDNKKIKVYLNN